MAIASRIILADGAIPKSYGLMDPYYPISTQELLAMYFQENENLIMNPWKRRKPRTLEIQSFLQVPAVTGW